MEAKQLMVGNYLERYNKVTGVKDIIKVGGDTPFLAFEFMTTLQFNPIPLTEEWLLNFGFRKREGQTYYHLKFDKTWVSLDSILVKWYGNDVGGITMIDYVHQLQNLFFALEGEELSVIN